MLISYATQKDQKGVPATDPSTGASVTVAGNTGDIPPYQFRPRELDEGAVYRPIPRKIAPIWPQDSRLDVVITLSSSFNPTAIAQTPAEYVVLRERGFAMGNRSDARSVDTTFTVPRAVQNNGTLWGHFYVGLAGSPLDPKEPGFDPGRAYHFAYPMTQYLPKKKVAKTRNLLESRADVDAAEPDEEPQTGPVIANHYHPNASLAFVPAMGVKEFSTIHPAVKQFLRLEATGARDGSGQNGWYCSFPSPGAQTRETCWLTSLAIRSSPLRQHLLAADEPHGAPKRDGQGAAAAH